jgi:hypothetical protein
MTCFHNFTAPVWQIFAGNLLLLICSIFYLVWWVVCFGPNASGKAAGGSTGVIYLTGAFISGIAAIVLMSGGINTLSKDSKSVPVWLILLGGTVLFVAMLLITTAVYHRPTTSELIIIHIWAVLELSAIVVLYGTGRFGLGRTVLLVTLAGIAFAAGVICYVLYYRLKGTAGYWDGMAPLIIDASVMAVFLGVLAVS